MLMHYVKCRRVADKNQIKYPNKAAIIIIIIIEKESTFTFTILRQFDQSNANGTSIEASNSQRYINLTFQSTPRFNSAVIQRRLKLKSPSLQYIIFFRSFFSRRERAVWCSRRQINVRYRPRVKRPG